MCWKWDKFLTKHQVFTQASCFKTHNSRKSPYWTKESVKIWQKKEEIIIIIIIITVIIKSHHVLSPRSNHLS
jgi:hypothetical protein